MMTQQEKINFLKELIIELKGSKNHFEITEDTELYAFRIRQFRYCRITDDV